MVTLDIFEEHLTLYCKGQYAVNKEVSKTYLSTYEGLDTIYKKVK